MNWLFRPSTVALISGALVLVAGVLILWPSAWAGAGGHAVLRAVPPGDQEIVWLNAATNAVAWERLVAAVHRLKTDQPELGLELAAGSNPFPSQTTQVPEFAVTARGQQAKLWFRWYKLTADLGPREWVQAFAKRRNPPLAVIGGGSSDRARDLARSLKEMETEFSSAPLLLITTATADLVDENEELIQIYPGRSLRFCFTDSQMAEAVAEFVWNQEDLRPDAEPLYMTLWNDDPYSEDLFKQFHRVLGPDGFYRMLRPSETLQATAQDWAWLAARLAAGGVPRGLEMQGLRRGETPAKPIPGQFVHIPYSVGAYNEPNPWELDAARMILDELSQHPEQHRPLLVLPAAPQPARRLLRALLRTAPREARRLVVATGDAIDFNTIYRDRNLAWPIQDLPVPLILFCHRNPVDPQAFDPNDNAAPPDPTGRTSTGTQDLLLYRDIVDALVHAAYSVNGLAPDADVLAEHLRGGVRGEDGAEVNAIHPPADMRHSPTRFDEKGNQLSGTGEFIVCLRPVRTSDRILPRARLQVWNRTIGPQGSRQWRQVPVAGLPELLVKYSSDSGDE
jgi:hypothetical protein